MASNSNPISFPSLTVRSLPDSWSLPTRLKNWDWDLLMRFRLYSKFISFQGLMVPGSPYSWLPNLFKTTQIQTSQSGSILYLNPWLHRINGLPFAETSWLRQALNIISVPRLASLYLGITLFHLPPKTDVL